MRCLLQPFIGGLVIFLLGTSLALAQTTVEGLGLDFSFADDVPQLGIDGEKKPKDSWLSKFSFDGYFKNETAYRFREPRSFTKLRNILYLNAKYPVNDAVDVNFAGWAYYDLAYDLFSYDTIAARIERNSDEPPVFVERLPKDKDSPVVAIRELYVDFVRDKLEMRLGKQYIIWGVLEGVRVVDELNPMDFREMILPDLIDYRIPLWSLKLDYYSDMADFELVWIPDVQFHKPAPRGSEWELLQNVCADQPVEIICLETTPNRFSLKDSEFGLRVSKRLFDTEFSLSYFYTWDDFPVIFRTVRLPVDDTHLPAFFPVYTRISMYGGTVVKQFDSIIAKMEFAYVTDKYFGVRNTTDSDQDGYLDFDGELKRDHLRLGLGLEFNLWNTDISPGITQWTIYKHDAAIIQDRNDVAINLFVRKEFPAWAATFQMLAIRLVNLKELLLKPKMTFQMDDHLQLATGLDLFFGERSDFGVNSALLSGTFDPNRVRAQFFGNFHDNDRAYLEFKYSF